MHFHLSKLRRPVAALVCCGAAVAVAEHPTFTEINHGLTAGVQGAFPPDAPLDAERPRESVDLRSTSAGALPGVINETFNFEGEAAAFAAASGTTAVTAQSVSIDAVLDAGELGDGGWQAGFAAAQASASFTLTESTPVEFTFQVTGASVTLETFPPATGQLPASFVFTLSELVPPPAPPELPPLVAGDGDTPPPPVWQTPGNELWTDAGRSADPIRFTVFQIVGDFSIEGGGSAVAPMGELSTAFSIEDGLVTLTGLFAAELGPGDYTLSLFALSDFFADFSGVPAASGPLSVTAEFVFIPGPASIAAIVMIAPVAARRRR